MQQMTRASPTTAGKSLSKEEQTKTAKKLKKCEKTSICDIFCNICFSLRFLFSYKCVFLPALFHSSFAFIVFLAFLFALCLIEIKYDACCSNRPDLG